MTYTRPSLKEISDQIENDFNTRFGGDSRPTRFSMTKIISRVVAGAVHLIYGYIDYGMNQIIPDSASSEYLDRWSLIWGIQRKAATKSFGFVIFKGEEGAVIPAFTQISAKDGLVFETLEESFIKKGISVVRIESKEAGAKYNLTKNTSLNLMSPISKVQSVCFLDESGTLNGTDAESDDELRNRLLLRIRNPICAGNKQDYVNWALETPGGGVTRAWCFPQYQADGNVGVFFVKDNQENIIPKDEEMEVVRKHISSIMPCTARLYVKAPEPHVVNFVISTNVTDEKVKAEFKSKIENQLKYLFMNFANPYDGEEEGIVAEKGNVIKNEDILESLALIKSSSTQERFRLSSPKEDIILGKYEVGIVGTVILETQI